MLDPFAGYTYVTEHSPNCPSPYMVRMVGTANGKGVIDRLPHPLSKDAIGYGQTFEEAASKALAEHLRKP
jgi:hypothetical protein